MSAAKNTATLTPAQQERTTKALAPVEVVEASPAEVTHAAMLTIIQTTPQVAGRSESKVVQLTTESAMHSVRAERSAEVMAAEYLHHRRMFPALESVTAILGEDTPDLAGRTTPYKDAVARINVAARDNIVNGLRKEGFTVKLATAHADAELDRIRKSVTRYIRIAVEDEAKSILAAEGREAAARFILGHGFGYSGEVTSKSYKGVIEEKSWKLKDGALVLPEGKAISEDGKGIVDTTPAIGTGSDETKPTDTADAIMARLLESAGVTVGDARSIFNLAVGLLDRTAGLLPSAKLQMKTRNTMRATLFSAVKRVVGELEDGSDTTVDVETAVSSK